MAELRFSLPDHVKLPASLVTFNEEMVTLLGYPSKQLLRVWRVSRRFPRSYRDGNNTFIVTAELQDWLLLQGVVVERSEVAS